MTYIGINAGSTKDGLKLNDGGCCIIKDDSIYAIAEERLSRNKHDGGFRLSLPYCLNAVNESMGNIDKLIVSSCCEKPLQEFHVDGISDERIIICPSHHLSHAYSTYMTSGFDEALIIVIDNEGNVIDDMDEKPFYQREAEHMSYYIGNRQGITLIDVDTVAPDRIGVGDAYRYFTHYLGFPSYTYAGKIMGLSSYGEEHFSQQGHLFELNNGHIVCQIPNDYMHCEAALADFLYSTYSIPKTTRRFPIQDIEQIHADLAAFVQKELERILILKTNYLIQKTKIKKLCIAGGVGLNSVANGKLLKACGITDIHIVPAAGDSGQCLGNALYGYCQDYGFDKHFDINNAYLGMEYTQKEIADAINKSIRVCKDFEIKEYDDIKEQADTIASLIYEGCFVGIFCGRSEFGPRSLGNRSILADPRKKVTKDDLNMRVKYREFFRPFAPVVVYEKARDFFDLNQESPYMLLVADVKCPEKLQAVTHIDGSARIQTIRLNRNPLLYYTLNRFEILAGIPILLNTSFNLAGQPIVESPDDAIGCFKNSNIDALSIGNYIIKKTTHQNCHEIDDYTRFVVSLGRNLAKK